MVIHRLIKRAYSSTLLSRNNSFYTNQLFQQQWRPKYTPLEPKSLGSRSIHLVQPLPFVIEEGLPPLFSAETLKDLWEYQSSLIDTLNNLVAGTEFEQEHIFTTIAKTAQVPEKAQLFNCASQVWNNDFFLRTLSTSGKQLTPLSNSSESIKYEFGSFENFQNHFKYMALGLFGSGWTWLVLTEFRVLRIINTYNAGIINDKTGTLPKANACSTSLLLSFQSGTPLDTTRLQSYDPNNHPSPLPDSPFFFTATSPFSPTANINESTKPLPPPSIKLVQEPTHQSKFIPLLALNVWEHAYLRDFGMEGKEKYIDAFWNCVDWYKVEERITAYQLRTNSTFTSISDNDLMLSRDGRGNLERKEKSPFVNFNANVNTSDPV
ncbi:6186_t:CDS:2 [Acaulospora morrowiae]|uniref:6186_t:CDS:1 n=1 Tax=Acaulospora morrowiae TaxID=94023 RepID=A0A9N8V5Y5_9GLOM|nr:6186_t:CDS:2 [Acaulospora morrowiae]